jgi:ATP synthase protein I
VNLSDESTTPTPAIEESQPGSTTTQKTNSSMQEFYQLFQGLLSITLGLTGIIFICVWIFYSLNTALNYLLGAVAGMVYLKMLARDVEQLGQEKKRLSKTRLALFIGVIVVATQVRQLQVLPIFLGFLTYKATLIVYTIQTAFIADSK